MTPFHALYTAGLPVYHTGFHCIMQDTPDNRKAADALSVPYQVSRNSARNILTIETPYDREVALASVINELRFKHLMPQPQFKGGEACSCGCGITSAVDGKCGHCRSKKERSSFDQFHRLQGKVSSDIEREAIGGNVENVYRTLSCRVDGINEDIVFSDTESSRVSSLLTALIVADGNTDRIKAAIQSGNPFLTEDYFSAVLGSDIEDPKKMQRSVIEKAVSRSAHAAFTMP